MQSSEHSNPPASLEILARGSFLYSTANHLEIWAPYSQLQQIHICCLMDSRKCHISLCGLRRNVFSQFAGPTSRRLRFCSRPYSSSVCMASARTYALILLIRKISFVILSQSGCRHPSEQFIKLNEDTLYIRSCDWRTRRSGASANFFVLEISSQ